MRCFEGGVYSNNTLFDKVRLVLGLGLHVLNYSVKIPAYGLILWTGTYLYYIFLQFTQANPKRKISLSITVCLYLRKGCHSQKLILEPKGTVGFKQLTVSIHSIECRFIIINNATAIQ